MAAVGSPCSDLQTTMADDNEHQPAPAVEEDEDHPNYKPPAAKSLKDIVEADKEDPSLQKYKETLLGAATAEAIVVEPDNPSRVLVKKLALVVEGRPDVVLDLTEDLENLKKRTFTVKEGIQYRIRIEFFVQREIVTGLKYVQKIYRHGLQVEKMNQMVGSYAPKSGDPVVHHAPGGHALGHAGPGVLLRQVALHRRRQARAPQVGVDLRDQEGLGLGGPRRVTDRPTDWPSPATAAWPVATTTFVSLEGLFESWFGPFSLIDCASIDVIC
ncbi:hypothetical protein HPB48_008945 [Haemaphysalis longicornis]|uniref:Uncharacterized protein n=1 Tax=Haemaphysalis longicornis TaxID=44386 RepID=A0A9J6FFT4_HAELO|nr:hypothetical protein HPB48_008945 [Haemaphysalis longicornis]